MDRVRDRAIFINCPFDRTYKPIFDALVFAITYCGFAPRSALEIGDPGELRLAKIIRLIGGSRFSIHDISRIELDEGSALPRFNMPIELGIAIGAKHLGDPNVRDHMMLVLDVERYRYQQFASDLAGVDIEAHANDPTVAINAVRDFLAPHAPHALPGAAAITTALSDFERALPAITAAVRQDVAALNYVDRIRHIELFIASDQE